MKPPFKFSWEEVTPAMAKEWLKKNGKNRSLRRDTVDAFASDMARGAWSPTHQGVAFEIGGELIDGQHRLAAIVQSGVAIQFLVCRDVPKRITGVNSDVMDAIDRGNARSIADVLKLAHGYKVNANLVAAVCAMIARICIGPDSYQFADRRRAKKLTLSQTLAVLNRYRAGIKFISENRTTSRGLRPAHICAAIAFAHAVEPRQTEEFYTKFSSGIGMDADSPVLTIRNFFLDDRTASRGSIKERSNGALLVLHALYCFIHSIPMPRMPREDVKSHASFFLDRQSDNVAFIGELFPKVDASATVITPKTFKLTPAAEALLHDKEMSERLHHRPKGPIQRMQQRIARGELAGPVR